MAQTQMILVAAVVGIGAGIGAESIRGQNGPTFGSDSHFGYSQPGVVLRWRNERLKRILEEIEARSAGMRLTPGDDTIALLREAREGGMYGTR
jgi:hypothetical protein